MKKHANLSIDEELIRKFKERGMSMSEIAENAMREELNLKKIEIDTKIDTCQFCNKKEEQANPESPHNGLSWLWPDEKWICSSCMRRKGKNITK
ncbi:MAG: hypothetical protein GWP19_00915 [Planctomycetia bacterium]|nr:hypothetical protein [Planctomycetia bacterium]